MTDSSDIDKYEKIARNLELPSEFFKDTLKALEAESRQFMDELETRPAWLGEETDADVSDFPAEGKSNLQQLIKNTFSALTNSGIDTASGKFLGFIPGGWLETAAIADYISAITNRFVGFNSASPGAVAIENAVISWMCKTFKLPEQSWGTVTSGGSMANLLAIFAAREAVADKPITDLVCYLSDQSHHSLSRSFRLLGIKNEQITYLPTNTDFEIDSAALKNSIEKDLKDGKIPWLIIANAGTTNTGAVDPLVELASLAKTYDLWLHADAAYGGFFTLAPFAKEQLSGLSLVDSITVDPHKGLFLPYGCGTLLVKQGSQLKQALSESADYLMDIVGGATESPADYSIELTRHFRSLRIWLSLQYFGVETFSAALSEKILLARYFYKQASLIKNLEILSPPTLSLVLFRVKGDSPDGHRTHQLQEFINQSGESYVSGTELEGKYYLRCCVLSFRTHKNHIEKLLKQIHKFENSRKNK